MNTNELKEYTGRVPVFILKAYDMVQLSHEKYFDTLCWNEDGSGFIVKNRNILASELIPKYFNHVSYFFFLQ